MDDLTKLTVEDFLDQVADRSPTPGGGSVTGAAGALACSLARMVAAYSVEPTFQSEQNRDRKGAAPARTQVETAARHLYRLDQIIQALITQDAVAYAEMTTAKSSEPRTSVCANSRRLKPAARIYTDAVLAAVAVPMEMAAVASNALVIMDDFKTVANRRLLTDLGIAAVLADATARAARYTVRINTHELTDDKQRTRILADIEGVVEHCAIRRESIETFVARSTKCEERSAKEEF